MAQAADPRSIVTPDAFSVDPPLLGTPLAPPRKRLWALLLDFVAIFMITATTESVWYVVPFIIGFLLLTRAFKRGDRGSGSDEAPKRSQGRFSGVFRMFLGCMGVTVLMVSAIVVAGLRFIENEGGIDQVAQTALTELAERSEGEIDLSGIPAIPGAEGLDIGALLSDEEGFDLSNIGDALMGAGGLVTTNDPDEAREIGFRLASRMADGGVTDDSIEDNLETLMSARDDEDEVGGVDTDDIIDDVMDRLEEYRDDKAAAAEALGRNAVDELSIPAATEAYAAWLAEDEDLRDPDHGAALRNHIGPSLAGTVEGLRSDVEGLTEDRDDAIAAREAAENQGGVGSWLRSKLDTFSFGLGWLTIYFAVLMPLMKGATPGKKIMGIRVVRLDGQPITWWHAFERTGGYAAGLATGTLGFMQVYWDPNRQAIHDKVAGTVVVLAGAQRVPGQWEHVVAEEDVRIRREAGDTEVPDAPPAPVDPDPTPVDAAPPPEEPSSQND